MFGCLATIWLWGKKYFRIKVSVKIEFQQNWHQTGFMRNVSSTFENSRNLFKFSKLNLVSRFTHIWYMAKEGKWATKTLSLKTQPKPQLHWLSGAGSRCCTPCIYFQLPPPAPPCIIVTIITTTSITTTTNLITTSNTRHHTSHTQAWHLVNNQLRRLYFIANLNDVVFSRFSLFFHTLFSGAKMLSKYMMFSK